MKNNKQKNTGVVVYQAKSGAIELRQDANKQTIWATLDQIAEVFGRDKSVISRHLKNIYMEGELSERATVAKNATVQIEGKRTIKRVIEYYNLDAIISVGYRVNSKTATKFRQWATKTLRQYITQGFAINKKRIAEHYSEFQKVVEDMKHLFPPGATIDSDSVLELISAFVICSFWVIQSLARLGKTQEANDLLHGMIEAANHVGLFSEHYLPSSHQQLGNFPQAYSHVGMINATFSVSPPWSNIL
jgi:hypothetical protein